MARTVDPEAHAVKRDAFVDVAQWIVQTRGYGALSIQAVLDELDASRGAFYHYFESKQALLEAVAARLAGHAPALVEPIAADPKRSSVEKITAVLTTLSGWDSGHPDAVAEMLGVWYSDANAIVREKTRLSFVERLTPLFAAILRQGVAEGALTTAAPDETGRVLAVLSQAFSDDCGRLLVARRGGRGSVAAAERTVAAYAAALERVAGLPAGSVRLAGPSILRIWYG